VPTTQRVAAYEMLCVMARMQAEHNTQVHPDWQTQNYAYYRAIWVECAELLDHYGWKWWKHQSPDLAQAQLELVDIWHFGLSDLLRADALSEQTSEQILEAFNLLPAGGSAGGSADRSPGGFLEAVEDLATQTLSTRQFPLKAFAAALAALPMTYEALFELYIGKNVLNRFRQDQGYKTGAYRKLWDGREDNVHLMELLEGLPAAAPDYAERLYAALAERYAASCQA